MTVHEDRATVTASDAVQRVAERIPAAVPATQRQQILEQARVALAAVRQGDGAAAELATERARRLFERVGVAPADVAHWRRCEARCAHHLGVGGSGTAYAVCFWAGVIRGRERPVPGWD